MPHRLKKSLHQIATNAVGGLRKRVKLLTFNLMPLVIVEFFYTLITACIVTPAFSAAIQAVMSSTGLESITVENAPVLLANPITIISLIVLVLFISFYSLLDIGAAIFTFDCSRQNKPVTTWAIVAFSLRNAVRTFKPRNLPIIFACLVLVPFAGLGMSSSILSSLTLPSGIEQYIGSHFEFLIVGFVVIIVFFVISLKWMYAVHFYTLDKLDFASSIQQSCRLKRSNRISNLISMVAVQVLVGAASKALTLIGIEIVTLILDIIGAKSVLGALLTAAAFLFFFGVSIFLTLLSMPLSTLKISSSFYNRNLAAEHEINGVSYEPKEQSKRARAAKKAFSAILAAFVLIVFALYCNIVANDEATITQLETPIPKVYTYCGSALESQAPGLKSIEKAADVGANGYVATVQITKDNKVFLSPTAELQRVCGFDGNCWEVDFDEIAEMPLQKKFTSTLTDGNTEDEYPTLLSDALEYAKEHGLAFVVDVGTIDYNDYHMELVLDEILKADMLESCEIASNKYADLEEARLLEPNVQTLYIAGLSTDTSTDGSAASAVALEGMFITESNVKALANHDIQTYAWNVAGEDSISEAILTGVNALVTTDTSTAVTVANRHGLTELQYTFYSHLK